MCTFLCKQHNLPLASDISEPAVEKQKGNASGKHLIIKRQTGGQQFQVQNLYNPFIFTTLPMLAISGTMAT